MKHEQQKNGMLHNIGAFYCLLITALVMLLWEPSTQLFFRSSQTTTFPVNHLKPTVPQCFEMPIPELLQAISQNDEEAELWGAAALAMRDEEAMPYIKATLQDGTPREQYSLARTLKDANPERYKDALLQMATNPKSHSQAQIGALYALSRVSLDEVGQQAIVSLARNVKSAPVRRTALIALQHSSLSTILDTLEAFLEDDDPITPHVCRTPSS